MQMSSHSMFTKLDMVDNQPLFPNYKEGHNTDVISDVTVDQFRLGISIFRTCKYNNLLCLHQIFTKLDMIDNQVVLTNLME